MKLEKVNDSKLLWSLYKDDFITNKLNINDLLLGTPKARKLFQQAMVIAEKEYLFHAKGYLLYCQLQELNEDGVTFAITKKKPLKKDSQGNTALSDEIVGSGEVDGRYHLLYAFSSIDEVIQISSMVDHMDHLENSLYRFGDEYLLFVEPEKNSEKQLSLCTMNMTEFSEIEAVTKGQMTMLCEHSECILGKEALQQLRMVSS